MLKFLSVFLTFCASLAGMLPAAQQGQLPKQPKLILVIVVDQFRYDYLTRFQGDYTSGLDLLLKKGAVFTNAYLKHFPTVTAAGHATVLTGATPALSGIVGNEWYDRESGEKVTSVSDSSVKLLGGANKSGASPHRLLVSTVGDELKMAGKGESRMIGMSLKDRSAILPAGHMADGAYWFDDTTGNFVSSSYYFAELPAWVREFNAGRSAERYSGLVWSELIHRSNGGAAEPFEKLPVEIGPRYYESLVKSPFGNDLLESFAEHAIEAEQFGARDGTDVLTVSFSSNDYVGHEVGPDSPEVRDISIRTDRVLGKFFEFLRKGLGLENVLVIMTADHGVAPVPEVLAGEKMPGGRVSDQSLTDTVESALSAKYGERNWVLYSSYGTFFLNRALIQRKNLKEAEVEDVAVASLMKIPHVFRVYTREQLKRGQVLQDAVSQSVSNGFNVQRSGDVIALLEPYWSFATKGTTHGSVYSYDTHVPVIFMGADIRPGRYDKTIAPNDIAPTLATLLDIETPSGSAGRVLTEMLVRP